MEDYAHAALVAKDKDGKLFILESHPERPPVSHEFQGKRTYFVMRPKPPAGMTAEEFGGECLRLARLFADKKFGYDAMLSPVFRDAKAMDKLRDLAARDSRGKSPRAWIAFPRSTARGSPKRSSFWPA